MLREPAWSTVGVYVVLALVGAGAGWLAHLLAEWLLNLPSAPLRGPAEFVASVPVPALAVVGSAAGLALGGIAQYEQTVIRLTDERVVLLRMGSEQAFPRDEVAAAYRDGKHLVLLGHDGGELARERCDVDPRRVAGAFTAHGYRWADEDPHREAFRLWVPGVPGLPEGAEPLLKARQEALRKKDLSDDDVRELRRELARLGVVVRDDKRRQYWRMARQPDTGAS